MEDGLPDPGSVVILGVGNILLTDEGTGPAVVEHLRGRWRFPEGVLLADGATAGLELINLFRRAGHLVVIDAVRGGGEPGALYRFNPGDVPAEVRYRTSIHQVTFTDAWEMARLLGPIPEVTIIGVEPYDMATPHVGLSPRIASRLPAIEELVLEELAALGIVPERR